MGGTIEVKMNEENYIVFRVRLPLYLGKFKDLKNEEIDDENERIDFDNLKVLIGEDDELNALSVSIVVKELGCLPSHAKNWSELFSKAASEDPDLILLDYAMPGMNGIMAVEKLKSDPLLKNIPIIAITGQIFTDAIDCMLAAGADTFLNKPIEVSALSRKINEILLQKSVIG